MTKSKKSAPQKAVTSQSRTGIIFFGLFLMASFSLFLQERLLQAHLFGAYKNESRINENAALKSFGNESPGLRKLQSLNASTSMGNHFQVGKSNYTDDLLFGDSQGSSKILLQAAQQHRPIFDDEIDEEIERARCARYKLNYTHTTSIASKARRRIFWGANIADDSWHVISTQAIETYGIFHTVAFVESNRTSMGSPRKLRFEEHSENKRLLTEKGIFGHQARVTVDYYVNENEKELKTLISLEREHAQRALIIERWRMNGMTTNDIGYLSDTDETFSRDFLRAMQICDVPQFVSEGKDGHNRCAAPKVYGLVTIFEGSPECVSTEEIYHPALMIGECIEGIGSDKLHPKPTRHRNLSFAWRDESYTYNTFYSALHPYTRGDSELTPPKSLPSNVYFPLWNAADYRRHPGGFFYGEDRMPLFVGYHVHNFFDDMDVLRHKYLTYGHGRTDANIRPLGEMNRQVNLMVRCAMDPNNTKSEDVRKFKSNDERRQHPIARRKGGLDYMRRANYGLNVTGGAVPLAFRIEEYVAARHSEMVSSIENDEKNRRLAMSKLQLNDEDTVVHPGG